MPADHPPSLAAARVRRRTLLGAAFGGLVALGAAGCGPDGTDGAASPEEVTVVLAGAVTMAAAYQAAAVAQPGLADKLNPLEAEHRTHISALQAALGRTATPTPATTPSTVAADPTGALAQLRDFERAAQAAAEHACLSVPQRYVALLASIAACRATHVEALS